MGTQNFFGSEQRIYFIWISVRISPKTNVYTPHATTPFGPTTQQAARGGPVQEPDGGVAVYLRGDRELRFVCQAAANHALLEQDGPAGGEDQEPVMTT